MTNDILKLRSNVWEAYAFTHDLDEEFYSPLIFTADTVIGSAFEDREVMVASSDFYEGEFKWIPVATIRKWQRREDGLWATGSLLRSRDYQHMNILRPLLQAAAERQLIGLTYSGDKNLTQFVAGSKRVLKRFPVLFLSFYFRRSHATQEPTRPAQGVHPAQQTGEDVPTSAAED